MRYKELLRDVRWQQLRLEAMNSAGWKCQECNGNDFLNVHHRRYVQGRKPWEYSIAELKVLCESCHAKTHGLVYVHDRKDEGEHQCGDWKGESWWRNGTTFFVNGIPFHLYRWIFCEDGTYGAIYFKISGLVFEPESNNGASFIPFEQDDEPEEWEETVDALGVKFGGIVRCATPCMPDGENFMPFPMEWIIFQAAQFAVDNLTRKK